MPQRIRLLYKLQCIDTQIATRKRRYNQVQARLGENEALRQARAARDEVQAELTRWRTALRDCELDVAATIAKYQETEALLYGGQVKNPKELGNLEKESQYLQRYRITLEERQIEAMMNVEKLSAACAAAEQACAEMEAQWRQENVELSQEYDGLRQELARLMARRKVVLPQINPYDLEQYEAMRGVKGGIAVIAVRGGICQTCNVEIPQRIIERAKSGQELMYCTGCDRLVYVAD